MNDAVATIAWFAVNATLVWGCYEIVSRACDGSHLDRLRDVTVLWAACVVGGTTALGAFGLLTPWSLLVVGALLGAGAILVARRWLGSRRSPSCEGNDRCFVLAWSVLGCVALAHVVVNGVLAIPLEWDTLNYHLPLVVQWRHAHSLYAPECAHWSLAANNELFGLWMTAPFSGDFFSSMTNVPATIMLALSTLELGRLLGLGSILRNLTAISVLVCHTVVAQLISVGNDVAVAGFLMGAACYGLRYARTGRRSDILLSAVCLGVLAGVKYYALGYAVVGWVTVTLATWLSRGTKQGFKAAMWLNLGLLLFAGYWYIRNAVHTGSPVYPLSISFPRDVQGAIYPDLWGSTFFGNESPRRWGLFLAATWRLGGPVYTAALVALPMSLVTMVAVGIRAWFDQETRSQAVATLAAAGLTLGSVAVFAVTPFCLEDQPGTLNQLRTGFGPIRYGMCFLSLAVLVLACLLQQMGRVTDAAYGRWTRQPRNRADGTSRRFKWSSEAWPQGASAGIAICTAVAAARALVGDLELIYWRVNETVLVAINLFVFSLIAISVARRWSDRLEFKVVVVLLLTFASVAGTSIVADRWHREFASFYDRHFATRAFTLLEDQAPAGTGICPLVLRPYPFFGSRRQFRVVQPIHTPSREYLFEFIDLHEAQLVVTRTRRVDVDSRGYALGYTWLTETPEIVIVHQDISRFAVFGLPQPDANWFLSGHSGPPTHRVGLREHNQRDTPGRAP